MMTFLYRWNNQVFIVISKDISDAHYKLKYLTRSRIVDTNVIRIDDAVVVNYDNEDRINYEVLD